MERRTKVALAIGGAAVATAGIAYAVHRRRKSRRVNTVVAGPRTRTSTSSGDMKLTHHRSSMPIAERVGLLQDLTYKSIQDPRMRKLALQITKSCPERDGLCEARAIYNWMRKNIRYTGDVGPHKLGRHGPVEGIDLFQTAARTVEFGGGDCDDHSILACTLAAHNGLACKYRVTAPTRGRGEDYSHIYAMAGVPKNSPKKWVALDTTLPGTNKFNYETPYGKKRDFVA
jgi:transglutaminase-like putative cysteine protease